MVGAASDACNFIPEFENLYLSLYVMAEIATHPYTKWQKSRPIPIPELKNCDPSERHLRTRHFLGVNPPGEILQVSLDGLSTGLQSDGFKKCMPFHK